MPIKANIKIATTGTANFHCHLHQKDLTLLWAFSRSDSLEDISEMGTNSSSRIFSKASF